MGSPHWSCGVETRDKVFLAKLWLEQNLFITDALSFFFGNDNKYFKDIGLGNILKNILWENDKIINFSNNFLYFLWK